MGFDNTCTVSRRGNVFRVIPRLYGSVLKLFPLMVEHSVVVMSARTNLWVAVFDFRFIKFVFRISGGINC